MNANKQPKKPLTDKQKHAISQKTRTLFELRCSDTRIVQWSDPQSDHYMVRIPAYTGKALIDAGYEMPLHLKRVMYYLAADVAKKRIREELKGLCLGSKRMTLESILSLDHESRHWIDNPMARNYRARAYDSLVAYELWKQHATPRVLAISRPETKG